MRNKVGQELPKKFENERRNKVGQEVPKKFENERRAFPTPRQWLREVTKYLGFPSAQRCKLIGGLVGHDIAAEFEGFLLNVDKIATPSQIEADPDNCLVPDQGEMAARFYAVGMLTGMATRKNIANVFAYAKRLGDEFYMLFGLNLSASNPAMCDTRAYVQWCADTGNGDAIAA
jgi:hypothetical protein